MKQDRAEAVTSSEEDIQAVRHLVFIDIRPDQPSVSDDDWDIEMQCSGRFCECGWPLPRWENSPLESVVSREPVWPFYAAPFAPIYRVDVLERIMPLLVRPLIGRVILRHTSGDRVIKDYHTLSLSRFEPRLSPRGDVDARYSRCRVCGLVSCRYYGKRNRGYYLRDQLRGGLVQTCMSTGMLLVADTVLDKLRLDTLPDGHLLQYMKYPLRDEPIDGRRMKMFLPLDEVKARLKKRVWKKPTKKEVRAQLDQMRALGLLISAVESEPAESTPAKAATPAKKKRLPRK